MESRKRAKQPLEQDGSNVKRVKHTIKALFRGEGSTGTGASSHTLPREDTLEDEPSDGDSDADNDINRPIATNTTTEENQNGLADASQSSQNPRVNATSAKKRGLKKLLKTGVLGPVADALGPIKQVAEIFVECVDTYKVAERANVEHDGLIARLEGLFEDLIGHFDDGCSQPMTTSMKRLCKSIQEELETLKDTKGKNKGSRYLAADDEADVILACYRRVEGYLERLSLNANLSTWKIAHEQATNYQSDRMFSLIDRLPSVLSARYNSSEGEALKRGECTAGTRVREIAKLLGWVRNKAEGSVYWLNGMAGTGKTTIAYSVCAGLDSAHMLGASFFCSRLREECRNVNKIIPSIAYQLARFSRPFQYALCNALEKDPDAHGKVLQVQFDALIKDPILQVQHTFPEELTVVIDALDECEDKQSTRRMLEVLLNESTNLPIRFVLSSRPEPEIRDQMTERVKSRLVLHELDKDEVQLDIETYLRAALVEMKPSEDQVAALVAKSGILFIYAATAVRYIGYDNFQSDPHDRLRDILGASGSQEDGENEEIDQLYITVLEAAFGNRRLRKVERDNMQQVLHTVVCARDPLTVSGLSELLQIHSPDRVRAVLRPLWSVLHIIGESELVTTLHASFPDFMFDSSRSKAYSCDSETHNHTIAEQCFERIKRVQPRLNICGLESAYLPDRLVPNIKERVTRAISVDLCYACRYWADHVGAGKCTVALVTQLQEFVSTRLLLWMEVLNVKKQMRDGVNCMKLIVNWCNGLEVEEALVDLLRDAQRFVNTFASNPVSQSTPHIYVSMLPFWPRTAPIAKHYAHLTHGPVEAQGTALERRQLALLATWAFGGPINSIAVSQDGRHIALAVGMSVTVVDLSGGQVILGPLHGHSKPIQSIVFSPNQTRLLSGSFGYDDRTAAIIGWDTRTGGIVIGPLQLDGHTKLITSLAFSPDCTRIITGSGDESVRIWDAETGKMLRYLETRGRVRSIAFSSDSVHIAAIFDVLPTDAESYYSEMLQAWNVQNGNTTLGPLYTRGMGRFSFSPDNSRIAHTELRTAAVCVLDTQKGDILHILHHDHRGRITCIGYSPDGRSIISASNNRTIKVWDAQTGDMVLGPLEGHTGTVTSIAFSPGSFYVISGCTDGLVCTWNARQRNSTPHPTSVGSSGILSVKFSPNGEHFASGSKNGSVCIRDAYNGEILVGPINAHTAPVWAIDFLNDHLASGSDDGRLCVHSSLSGGLVLGPLTIVPGDEIKFIAYSADGSFIATGSNDLRGVKSEVNLWDSRTGARVLGPLKDFDGYISSILFSPDGTRIVGGSSNKDRRIVIWDAFTGANVFGFLGGHTSIILSVSYSPDGALLASGSGDKTIVVWDAYTGTKKLGPLTGHTHSVYSVSFSPDGNNLVSGSLDKTIRIWDIQTGETVFELSHGHEQGIKSVAYSPDGNRILSLAFDTTVRIHDALGMNERTLSNSMSEYDKWTMNKDGWVVGDDSKLL
ncbi:unnamed protein product, partial [Rhizoctonia solani]